MIERPDNLGTAHFTDCKLNGGVTRETLPETWIELINDGTWYVFVGLGIDLHWSPSLYFSDQLRSEGNVINKYN